jgi:hypothetical protein
MARPVKPIDAEMVRKLAAIGCTQEDIAECFGCSHSVIRERFRQEFHLGRAQSKISLRRAQFKRALAGSDAMLIHLGRPMLGQNYKVDVTPPAPQIIYLERANNPRDEQLKHEDLWTEPEVWSDENQIPSNGRRSECPPLNGPVFRVDSNGSYQLAETPREGLKTLVSPSLNRTH